jgi:uncharacterized protein (TIGR02444 family)
VRLWDYAVMAWEKPDVASLCLDLQDRSGQCVAVLLWRAWAAGEKRSVDGASLARALELARAWEGELLQPLRRARRSGLADPALAAAIRADELDAEHRLLDVLEDLTPPSSGDSHDLMRTLTETMAAWNGAQPEDAVRRLAERLV